MKIILFASALALSTVAYAQAPMTPADAGAATNAPPAMPAAPDSSMAPAPMSTPAPDASAPAATTPMMPATDPSATAAATDDSSLPMCSKTVTDKCKQGGKGMMHKKMMHKKK